MTDDFEDRLRDHLARQADQVRVEPDPSAFVDHAAGRSRSRGVLACGVAALTVVVGGAGILAGVNLNGPTTAAPPRGAVPAAGAGRAGADLAPAGSGTPASPSIVIPTPYLYLFTRVSASGVTVRAYSAGSAAAGGCSPAVTCVPTTTAPPTPTCPTGAECAQPIVVPHTSGTTPGGTSGSGNAAAGGVASPVTTGSGTTGSGTAGSGTTGSDPSQPATGCQPLVVELSTDRAVGTGSVTVPTAAPSAGALEVLGSGSFGTLEGAPVGWVAAQVGAGVTSVQLSVGGAAVDVMVPDSGIVVLAAPGNAGLDGASLVGLGPGGATADSVPVSQGVAPGGAGACPTPVSTPPATPAPTTTATTTAPVVPSPTTTTTTTTTTGVTGVTGAPVPAPTNHPLTTPGPARPTP